MNVLNACYELEDAFSHSEIFRVHHDASLHSLTVASSFVFDAESGDGHIAVHVRFDPTSDEMVVRVVLDSERRCSWTLNYDSAGSLMSWSGPSLEQFPQPVRQILWLAGLWNSEPVFRRST